MAKYTFTYSCGHDGKVALFGKHSVRDRKLIWYRNYGICPNCYREQMEMRLSATHNKVEMPYKEYIEHYTDCEKVPGSYNGETKTILVWVKKEDKR